MKAILASLPVIEADVPPHSWVGGHELMVPSMGLGSVSCLLCRARLTYRKSFSCYHCEENLQKKRGSGETKTFRVGNKS